MDYGYPTVARKPRPINCIKFFCRLNILADAEGSVKMAGGVYRLIKSNILDI